jgi:uncharacterized protein YjiK
VATAGRSIARWALVLSPVLIVSGVALIRGATVKDVADERGGVQDVRDVALDREAAVDDAWLPRYDLSAGAGRVVELPGTLAEVSGLAVDGRGRLLAHNDENGVVHVVDPATGSTLRSIPLGSGATRGDFEGIAVAGDRIFLVTSAGVLIEFEEPPAGEVASVRRVPTGLGKVCEVEGLAYEAATASLLLPGKTTRGKKLDDRLLVYAVPLATLELEAQPRVDVGHAELHAGGLGGAFHASAIEVHPRSGSLFLVAGRESAMVEISSDGRVLAARQLERHVHPQPEGLAFGPGLELWIADERVPGGGTLTRYPLAAGGAGK